MAVVKESQTSKLALSVETGTTASGATKYAQRTFSRINPALSDENLYGIGAALGTLQTLPVDSIIRHDVAVLTQE